MGQVASRRHHNVSDMKRKKGNVVKKYPLEIWRQIKDIEILQLQEKAKETEKEFERVKKKLHVSHFSSKKFSSAPWRTACGRDGTKRSSSWPP